jgi:hypothetical protein
VNPHKPETSRVEIRQLIGKKKARTGSKIENQMADVSIWVFANAVERKAMITRPARVRPNSGQRPCGTIKICGSYPEPEVSVPRNNSRDESGSNDLPVSTDSRSVEMFQNEAGANQWQLFICRKL